MAEGSTQYIVETIYRVRDDNAVKTTSKLAEAADKAGQKVGLLRSALAGVAGIGIGAGIKAFVTSLFHAASAADEAQDKLSLLTTAVLDSSYEKGSTIAGYMVDEIDQLTDKLHVSKSEVLGFLNETNLAWRNTGKSMQDWINLSAQSAELAKAMGVSQEQAGYEIGKALEGRLSERESWAKLIVKSQGINVDDFNNMKGSKRADVLNRGVNSQFAKGAVQDYEHDFGASIDRIKKAWQRFAETAGKPFLESVSRAAERVADWVDKHQPEIKAFAEKVGTLLSDGFQWMYKALSYLVDHKAEVTASFLAIQGAKSVATGAAQGAGQVIGSKVAGVLVGGGTTVGSTALMSGTVRSAVVRSLQSALPAILGVALNPLTLSLIITAVAAYGGWKLYQHYSEQNDARRERESKNQPFYRIYNDLQGRVNDSRLQADMFTSGLIKDNGKLDQEKAQAYIASMGLSAELAAEAMDRFRAVAGDVPLQAQAFAEIIELSKNKIGQPLNELGDTFKGFAYALTKDWVSWGGDKGKNALAEAKAAKIKDKGTTINIQAVNIDADDPDRFIYWVNETARKELGKRSSARDALSSP